MVQRFFKSIKIARRAEAAKFFWGIYIALKGNEKIFIGALLIFTTAPPLQAAERSFNILALNDATATPPYREAEEAGRAEGDVRVYTIGGMTRALASIAEEKSIEQSSGEPIFLFTRAAT